MAPERDSAAEAVAVAVPHVLLFPFPAQGHVPPMLKLADLLSQSGLRTTFLNTQNIHHRFLRHSPSFPHLAQRPLFRFRTIPDGLPDDDPRPTLQFLDLEHSLRTRSRDHFRDLLAGGDGWPPVTCVIADGMLNLALDVTEEMGLPLIMLRTSAACSVWAYRCIPNLIQNGELPFPEGADLDERVRGVPGMESFLRRRDLPGFCRSAKSAADRGLQFVATITANVSRARALILNTFEAMEGPVLSHIRSAACPVTYAVGPLQLLLRSAGNGASLWREDRACMAWLDEQPRGSVVYVSLGSVTVVSREELLELWHGLVSSGQRFLWAVRPDLVAEGMIPAEVEEGTRERGCVVGWAPQEEVLGHEAVGCFLTHSGWNSTVESAVAGVPMICWPFFADQQVNSRFVSEVWGIGVDMKDACRREVVERMVREVMGGGERGRELKRKAEEMAEMARRSAEEGGSSYQDLQRLIQHIKSMS